MNEWTSMLAYRLKGRIGPDRTLTIQLPPEAPLGEYEIILLYPDFEKSNSAIEESNAGIADSFDQRLDEQRT